MNPRVFLTAASGEPPMLRMSLLNALMVRDSSDVLSANPLGVSCASLFVIGFVIHWRRELILRDERYAQHVLGALASAAAPLITLFILLCAGEAPLLGWATFWQIFVMVAAGALAAPLFFRLFALFDRLLNHPVLPETSFRTDRELKRGRQ